MNIKDLEKLYEVKNGKVVPRTSNNEKPKDKKDKKDEKKTKKVLLNDD